MINLFNGFARFSSNPSWPFEVINKCVCICTHAYSNLKEVKYILVDDNFILVCNTILMLLLSCSFKCSIAFVYNFFHYYILLRSPNQEWNP